jgi:hypothetical protein
MRLRTSFAPDAAGRWCDLCVSSRATHAGHQAFCKSCGAVATPAQDGD